MPGSVLVGTKLSNGWNITSTDYLKNIVLLGRDQGGKYKKITLYNVMMDEPLEIKMDKDDESVIELKMSAHYDPADALDKLWIIEDLAALPPRV